MKRLFFNELQNVRPIWRLIFFILTFFLINVPLQIGLHSVLDAGWIRSTIAVTIYFIAAFGSLYIQNKFILPSNFSYYGLKINKKWRNEFGFGILISIIQIGVFCTVLYFSGYLDITGFMQLNTEDMSFSVGFINELYSLLLGASIEELFFRAFLFYILFESLRKIIASPQKRAITILLLSAPIFGIAHIGNDHASTLSLINLSIDAIVICLPFIITGRLGMSIGMHFSWNFIQGIICGFAISGNEHKVSLMVMETPSNLLTGGEFGIEGSVLSLPLTLIALGFILWWKKHQELDLVSNDILQKNTDLLSPTNEKETQPVIT